MFRVARPQHAFTVMSKGEGGEGDKVMKCAASVGRARRLTGKHCSYGSW